SFCLEEGPVESGERSTLSVPTRKPSQQFCPGVQGCSPGTSRGLGGQGSVPPVGQSRVRPCEFVVVQVMPARGPASQVPVAGLLGLPLTAGPLPPPLLHTGQGCMALPVRLVNEASLTFGDDAPVLTSMVPLAGAVQVFITHELVPLFAIGSGVPKLQPTVVQSGSAVLTAGTSVVGPIVQVEPAQLSENRLVEPSGVGPSATVEKPPPMFRPPQVRFFSTASEESRAVPQVPPAARLVKSRVKQSWVQGTVVTVVVVVGLVVPMMDVVVVLVVVVVAHVPLAVQPSPTLCGEVVHTSPFLHFPFFTILLMSFPRLFASQHTSTFRRPQIDLTRKRLTNAFLQGPDSMLPMACLASLT